MREKAVETIAAVESVPACLVCKARRVNLFLDLGRTPLANKFLLREELDDPEPAYPLRVGFCGDCAHVQLMDRVTPEAMFDDYLYVSGASDTLRRHLHGLSDVVNARYRLGPEDLVVDVGCNDGTLLQGFRRHGVRVLGVDPARNLAELAKETGIPRYVDYFGLRTALDLRGTNGRAAVVTATNTFPHIPDLDDFLTGLDALLADDGVFVVEAHYLLDFLEQMAFDTVYHEHVSYWSLRAMQRLFGGHGFEVVDVERLPIHHGQLRVFVERRGRSKPTARVAALREQEQAAGLDKLDTFHAFANRATGLRDEVRKKLMSLRAQGARIAAYGAPAKGSTLLSFLNLPPGTIEYIVDKSTLKQGRFTPGTRIPILSPKALLDNQPEYVLLLAWNFADEILQQQDEYRRRGGRFILPVPQVRTA